MPIDRVSLFGEPSYELLVNSKNQQAQGIRIRTRGWRADSVVLVG